MPPRFFAKNGIDKNKNGIDKTPFSGGGGGAMTAADYEPVQPNFEATRAELFFSELREGRASIMRPACGH